VLQEKPYHEHDSSDEQLVGYTQDGPRDPARQVAVVRVNGHRGRVRDEQPDARPDAGSRQGYDERGQQQPHMDDPVDHAHAEPHDDAQHEGQVTQIR